MRESLISASYWPVFEEYVLVKNVAGEMCIGPAVGSTIREHINLLDPATRSAALRAALPIAKTPRKRGRPRKENDKYPVDVPPEMRACTTPGFWSYSLGSGEEPPAPLPEEFPFTLRELLQPLSREQESVVLEYVSRFGLFGLGPSRIVRAQQRLARHPHWLTNVVRSAGGLIETGEIEPNGQPSSVELEDPWGNYPPPWEQYYCRMGTTVDEMFSHEIGSEEWWSYYVEPLKEVPRALQYLLFPDGLESRLADTFVDLSRCTGRAVFDCRQITWRSISAMGALALAVLEGELDGWEICPYCREPFKPNRRGTRFCSTAHQKKHWESERAKPARGGNE